MSQHDPKDGLTDEDRAKLVAFERWTPKELTDWIRRLARENATLKAERDNASGTLRNLNIDVGYNHADGCDCMACMVRLMAP